MANNICSMQFLWHRARHIVSESELPTSRQNDNHSPDSDYILNSFIPTGPFFPCNCTVSFFFFVFFLIKGMFQWFIHFCMLSVFYVHDLGKQSSSCPSVSDLGIHCFTTSLLWLILSLVAWKTLKCWNAK